MNWIFQANPKLYDLAAALVHRPENRWAMNQGRQLVSTGDRIYFWVSGNDARFVAVGRVTSAVYQREENQFGKYAVDVAFDYAVEPPLRRSELLGDAPPVLRSFRPFAGFMGTNLRLTDEAVVKALDELLQPRLVPLAQLVQLEEVDDSQVALDRAIKSARQETARELLEFISSIDPTTFEWLVRAVLAALGYTDIEVTKPSNDGGVDLRAKLTAGGFANVETAVQVKRTPSVGRPVVQALRGSLSAHESGLLVTSGRFTDGAIEEARERTRTPIALVDGTTLVDLLLRYEIGARERTYKSYVLDRDALTLEALQTR